MDIDKDIHKYISNGDASFPLQSRLIITAQHSYLGMAS